MEIIVSPRTRVIIQNRKRLERELRVKITNRGREITIEGKPIDEYFAKNVIDAINFGFSVNDALLLKKEDYLFEIINIKSHTKSKNMERIRGRIIGKGGKTLKTLSQLTGCKFEMKNNDIGIIGEAENMKNVQEGIVSLIKGAKTSNVYAFLEKHQSEPILDLGLKEKE